MAHSHRTDVLVAGGGLAGLACAVALADRGLRVEVLERSAELGGRARSWRHAPTGDVVDIGPHILHSGYRNFPALLERLGTRDRVSWQPGKLITFATHPPSVLRHNRLPPPLSLLPSFVRTAGLSGRDLRSNNRVTWRALKFGEEDVPELDREPAEAFLRRHGVTSAMIDGFWRFACMAVMNVPVERCSAAALMRVHSQLIGYRGLHFGFPAIGLGELYVAQAAAAVEAAGGRVRAKAEVVRVEEVPAGVAAALADGSRVVARHAVLALPPAELEAACPGLAAAAAFEPSPYVSVYLWFDRRVGMERFWALPWAPGRLNYDFYDLARIREGWQGRPTILASNIIDNRGAQDLDDAAIVAATVREIAEFAPEVREARVLHADVHRIPMAICCPTVGTEMRRPATRTARRGIFLAGDWTATRLPSSMESAVRSGFLAAEAVLEAAGRPERIALAPRETDGLAGLVRGVTRRLRPGARPTRPAGCRR